jgi:hypothetical protein
MDTNSVIEVLFRGNWFSNQISVHIEQSTRRLNNSLEKNSKDTWEEMLKEARSRGSKLWDSTVYRFESFKEKDGEISLHFSTIPFSTRLGMNKHTNQVKALGKKYAPMGLFSSCLVETADNDYVFIEKSTKFYTDKKYAWVGGVFSESELTLNNGDDLLSAVKAEILEELGLSSEQIGPLTLEAGYTTDNWNVCMLFGTKISITSEQLAIIFTKKNDGEAKELLFIPTDSVEQKIELFEKKTGKNLSFWVKIDNFIVVLFVL